MLLKEVRRVLVDIDQCDDAEWMFGRHDRPAGLDGCRGEQRGLHGRVQGRCGPDRHRPGAGQHPAEQRAAADVLGVQDVVLLGYRNGTLEVDPRAEPGPGAREPPVNPDVILTLAPFQVLDAPVDWSHSDHMAAGEATLVAAYPES